MGSVFHGDVTEKKGSSACGRFSHLLVKAEGTMGCQHPGNTFTWGRSGSEASQQMALQSGTSSGGRRCLFGGLLRTSIPKMTNMYPQGWPKVTPAVSPGSVMSGKPVS